MTDDARSSENVLTPPRDDAPPAKILTPSDFHRVLLRGINGGHLTTEERWSVIATYELVAQWGRVERAAGRADQTVCRARATLLRVNAPRDVKEAEAVLDEAKLVRDTYRAHADALAAEVGRWVEDE